MKGALIALPIALAWATVSSATPPALPCTSDYKWPGGGIATAIGTGNIDKLAEWTNSNSSVLSYGRELARGRESIAKLLKEKYPAATGPLRFIVLDDAVLATFFYMMRSTNLAGKAEDFQTEGALLLRCEEPGTIQQIEMMSRPNGMAEDQLYKAAKEANG